MGDGARSGSWWLLDRAIEYTEDALLLARSASLGLPTPCTEWDLGALLWHMDDALAALTEAVELGVVELDSSLRPVSADLLVSRLVARVCAARETWAGCSFPRGLLVGALRLDAEVFLKVSALEIVVHGWDVFHALGIAAPLPDRLVRELHPLSLCLLAPAERGHRFAAPLLPSELLDHTPSTLLLAHLGRDAAWLPAPR